MAATVLPALVALSPTGWSRDLEKELWLYADFDSPMRVDGTACLQAPVVGEAVDGKFGKAAFFHQPVANRLPPMSELFPDGYPVKVGGGAFTLPPQKIDHPFVKGEKPTGAYTCSFYAKGAPGTQLTLEATLSPSEKGGKPAPGRQVVRFELKGPDGALRDESGLYAVKGGEARIRLLLSPEDLADTSGSKWQATVTDLTTGETAVLEFTMRDAVAMLVEAGGVI